MAGGEHSGMGILPVAGIAAMPDIIRTPRILQCEFQAGTLSQLPVEFSQFVRIVEIASVEYGRYRQGGNYADAAFKCNAGHQLIGTCRQRTEYCQRQFGIIMCQQIEQGMNLFTQAR